MKEKKERWEEVEKRESEKEKVKKRVFNCL